MTRIVSVVALTWCDLLYITKKDFFTLMKYYPTDLRVFESFATQKYESWIKINDNGITGNTINNNNNLNIKKIKEPQSSINTESTRISENVNTSNLKNESENKTSLNVIKNPEE